MQFKSLFMYISYRLDCATSENAKRDLFHRYEPFINALLVMKKAFDRGRGKRSIVLSHDDLNYLLMLLG